MKFNWWWLVFIVIIFLITCYAFLISLRNSKIDGLPKISKSIVESKTENAFVAAYNVVEIESSIEEYIHTKNLNHIDFDSLDFWVEREYHFYHKYLFFKEHVYSNDLRIIIEDPTSLLKSKGGFPFIGFKVKGNTAYSGDNGMGGEVCVLKIGQTLPNTLVLELFINDNNNEPDFHLGDIKVKLSSN